MGWVRKGDGFVDVYLFLMFWGAGGVEREEGFYISGSTLKLFGLL